MARPEAYIVRGAFKEEHRDVCERVLLRLEGNFSFLDPGDDGAGDIEEDEFCILAPFDTLSGARRVERYLQEVPVCIESEVSEYTPPN